MQESKERFLEISASYMQELIEAENFQDNIDSLELSSCKDLNTDKTYNVIK